MFDIRYSMFLASLLLNLCALQITLAADAPSSQSPQVKDLNTPRDFPAISSLKEWEARAKEIREQILISAGLWPLPEKTPLQTRIFGKIERDGYSIEKVHFQTYPGFYLAGNLYRPLGHGEGPFPAILNPHGHWKEGRLADTKDGSIAARCINFARQGMIAFSYDMVGFNDSHFANGATNISLYNRHRQFGASKTDELWNISLMGLQTWNSIRALDFLESLPDADRKRLACTGESGGGTQTFMLGAVEDRLAAQAPVVMVSHTMQGGCSCENMPGLRLEYSNMEIAAAAAPRPQLLVAATGDWTKTTLTVEGPAIAHIYELFKAPNKFHSVRFDFGHNYNQTSREAVYEWFGKWLLNSPAPGPLKETPYQKEPDADLRVFPDDRLPADAQTQDEFIESLKTLHRAQWQALVPRDKAGLERFKQLMLPAWRHTLQATWPASETHTESRPLRVSGQFTATMLSISRRGEDEGIRATYWAPPNILKERAPKLAVLPGSGSDDRPKARGDDGRLVGLPLSLLQHGCAVLLIDHFTPAESHDQFANFYTTYNRTKVQQRVRDLLTVCASAGAADSRKTIPFHVVLTGRGRAGLWALMAAPAANAVIADCDGLDVSGDQTLLSDDLFFPGFHNIGGFEGPAMLAAPHPALLHNTGANFPTDALRSAYQATGASAKLRVESKPLSDEELVNWIASLK
jgi:hypothetical protein